MTYLPTEDAVNTHSVTRPGECLPSISVWSNGKTLWVVEDVTPSDKQGAGQGTFELHLVKTCQTLNQVGDRFPNAVIRDIERPFLRFGDVIKGSDIKWRGSNRVA